MAEIKNPYEAPVTQVLELTIGSILVASTEQYESIPW